jgi:hypothetical protein
MFIRSALNGGLAEVDDEFGKELIAAGSWIADGEEPKVARKPRARKPAAEPAE